MSVGDHGDTPGPPKAKRARAGSVYWDYWIAPEDFPVCIGQVSCKELLPHRYVCLHISFDCITDKMLRWSRVGPGVVDTVLSYCHYCLNDTSLESILPYLEAKGVGVINASILSMGLLTEQVSKPVHFHYLRSFLKDRF